MDAPVTKADVNTGLLQGTLGGSVGRGADRRADTTQVGSHGDGQGQTDLSLIIGRKLGKHRGEQGQHHGGGSRIGHEHGENGDHDEEAQQHNGRIGAEEFQEGAGQRDVQAVTLGHDGQHETAQEQHHHRIGHGGHDSGIRDQRTVLRVAEETDTLVGNGEQGHHNHQQRGAPVGDDLKNPHEGGKDKQGNDALLYHGEGIDAEETHRYGPQEQGDGQHQRQEHPKLQVKLFFHYSQ